MSVDTMPPMSAPMTLTPSGSLPTDERLGFSAKHRPTWEIAYLFPAQGAWTEDDYLSLENKLGHHIRVELANGCLEVLPVPTEIHQDIIAFLFDMLRGFIRPMKLGKVSFSGIRVRTRPNDPKHYREPDIAFMKAENAHRRRNEWWDGADLLMEVVSGSPDDRKRDYEIKTAEYASAHVAEYWIVDPEERLIRVLKLDGDKYKIHGDFTAGMTATSVLLPGFVVSADETFAAGQ
jgi:Uma2 family endonuclease